LTYEVHGCKLEISREVRNMCEDFPCCGHEMGDCEGGLYGSDEAIIEAHMERMNSEYYDYDMVEDY
jgi:hypothetical protein